MRKLFTILTAVLLTASMFLPRHANAQAPEKMSYQAVVRDADNKLVLSSIVGMQISILQGSTSGIPVYVETQTPSTNANGLISIEIGGGTIVSGDFTSINWANGDYFIKTENDPTGGNNYAIIGTSQLLSVPYALHAKTADSITNKLAEIDPIFAAWDKDYNDLLNIPFPWDSNYISLKNKPDLTVYATKNMSNEKITNLADPTEEHDAATKAYVDLLQNQISMLKNTLNAGGLLFDIEGNSYNIVKIGSQVWMAENLRTTKYNDGTVIPLVNTNSSWDTLTSTSKAYCWYNDDIANKTTYGALYTWAAAMNGVAGSTVNPSGVQGVCPTGWHLPSDAEWNSLTTYLGGAIYAGSKLKETGTTHWSAPNSDATNETGFTALPCGLRDVVGTFFSIGEYSYWWTTTEYYTFGAYNQGVCYGHSGMVGGGSSMEAGLSVRCVRD